MSVLSDSIGEVKDGAVGPVVGCSDVDAVGPVVGCSDVDAVGRVLAFFDADPCAAVAFPFSYNWFFNNTRIYRKW